MTALTISLVGVGAGVTGRPSQAFPAAIENVRSAAAHVAVLLAQAKVNQIELLAVDAAAHHKVFRLQITMDVVAAVQIFKSLYLHQREGKLAF